MVRRILLFAIIITSALFMATAHDADARESWEGSISGNPDPPLPFKLTRVYSELTFNQPVLITRGPQDKRLYVLERTGKLYSFPENIGKDVTADLAIDLAETRNAKATYAFTFDPNFADNHHVYMMIIDANNDPNGSVISRFTMTGQDPPTVDPTSERELFRWKSGGHNGCCLKFGPDGYLYISTGDGAPPSPPDGNNTGQGVDDLLSCILRIDVSKDSKNTSGDSLAYTIPQDNPFVNMDGARGEIFAFGFRNPWRMSFDHDTGELWVGDVGWELWEMVFRVVKGGNYGWSVTEGPQAVRSDIETGPGPVIAPVAFHHHSEARSITGGLVYRGHHQQLLGKYLYGDYVTGIFWALTSKDNELTSLEKIAQSPLKIIGFGETSANELLVLDYDGGLYRLDENIVKTQTNDFPRLISETGLFTENSTPAVGVTAYKIAMQQYADGAWSEHVIALPDNETVMLLKDGSMQYPAATVLAKTIFINEWQSRQRRPVETQVMFMQDGQWQFYTYAWRADQSDADLVPATGSYLKIETSDKYVPGGKRALNWRLHSRTECVTCHNGRSPVLAFRSDQLHANLTGNASMQPTQLQALVVAGLVRNAEPIGGVENANKTAGISDQVKPMVDWGNPDRAALARSYLHVNCAHCHQPSGGGNATVDYRFSSSGEQRKLVNHRPTRGSFGIPDARLISAGDAAGSVILYRLSVMGLGHMPHLGSRIPDQRGIRLIQEWIETLPVPEETELTVTVDAKSHANRSEQDIAVAIDRVLDLLATENHSDSLKRLRLTAANNAEISPFEFNLYERFLAPQQIPKRLGDSVVPSAILALDGDASRGSKLFLSTDGIQCKNCHKIDGEDRVGKTVGPSFADIRKRLNREEILASILDPSAKIDAKYAHYIIETVDGRVLGGVLKEKTPQRLVLINAQGTEVVIPAQDVDFFERQDKSMMPDLQVRDMTAQQVADLLAFIRANSR
jgi:putative heme-binding domain-containing protein